MTRASTLAVVALAAILMALAAGLARSEPQPPPLCEREYRADVGYVTTCSGVLVSPKAYEDYLLCASDRASPCVDERAERDNFEAQLLAAQADLRATEQALAEAEAALVPKPEPVPAKWYARGGFWGGVALTAGSVLGAVLTRDHPAWWAVGGAGVGIAFVEAVR